MRVKNLISAECTFCKQHFGANHFIELTLRNAGTAWYDIEVDCPRCLKMTCMSAFTFFECDGYVICA
jgi:hypothetical protein